jgi:hypothetical protein
LEVEAQMGFGKECWVDWAVGIVEVDPLWMDEVERQMDEVGIYRVKEMEGMEVFAGIQILEDLVVYLQDGLVVVVHVGNEVEVGETEHLANCEHVKEVQRQ